jgi:antitoxin ParD1/3/4
MPRTMTLNVRVSGSLGDHVAESVGDDGRYENVSEYVRDLIRRDLGRIEDERLQDLKAELIRAFSAPDGSFKEVTADDVIARAKRRMHG